MTALKLTSIAAMLAMASATTLAQSPDQRAIALAQSIADQAAAQQPKAATANDGDAAKAAVRAGVASAAKGGQ